MSGQVKCQSDHIFLHEIFFVYVAIGMKWEHRVNVLVPRCGTSAVDRNKMKAVGAWLANTCLICIYNLYQVWFL